MDNNANSINNNVNLDNDTKQPIFTNILVTQETKILIQLIEELLETNNAIQINLTVNEIGLLKLLISKSPELFQNIETCINSIVQDNTINANDIPKFITLVKDFYIVFQNLKETTNNFNLDGTELVNISANIIKFIIPIVLKKYDLDAEKIIKICNDIIDISVDLLLIVPQVKNSKCNLFFCF